MRVGKWSLKGEGEGRGPTRFFSSGSPKDARQCEKKKGSWRGLGRQGRRGSLGKGRRRERKACGSFASGRRERE